MKQAMPLAAMSAFLLCGAVIAQTNSGTPSRDTYPGGSIKPAAVSFESLDANKDNAISKDEAKTSTTVVVGFDTADKNDDGILSKTEFDAYFNMR